MFVIWDYFGLILFVFKWTDVSGDQSQATTAYLWPDHGRRLSSNPHYPLAPRALTSSLGLAIILVCTRN